MGYCPQCGASVHDTESFCVSCGDKLPSDRHLRFEKQRFSLIAWRMPIIFLVIIGLFFGLITFTYSRLHKQAIALYHEATVALSNEAYEESLYLAEQALDISPSFEAASDLAALMSLYLHDIDVDSNAPYHEQLKQLNDLQIKLDDFKGDPVDQLIIHIRSLQEHFQLKQINKQLENDLSIQDLQALVWEIEAIQSTDALLLKQQLREQLSASIASLANTYLADNQFSEAAELVENGRYYLPEDERLLSLKQTIALAQEQFVKALEERMQKAYQSYEEEVVFNQSKAVSVTDLRLSQTPSNQLKVEGQVKNQGTVPIYHIQVTFELRDANQKVLDTREVFVYPEVLYPYDTGQLDYIYMHQLFDSAAKDINILAVSWLLNEEEAT